VSNPDDVNSRLSDALDEIFKGAPSPPGSEDPAPPPTPASTPRSTADPYVLPTIVEATGGSPVLPERTRTPNPPPPPPAPAPPTITSPPAAAAPVTQPVTRPMTVQAPAAQAPVPTTSWGDHIPPVTPGTSNAGLRAPGRRPRVRRVTRVIRHIDPWSTFKLALVFSLVGYLVCLTSGVLLWRVAESTGTIDNVERWFTQFGWETFEFDGGEVFHIA